LLVLIVVCYCNLSRHWFIFSPSLESFPNRQDKINFHMDLLLISEAGTHAVRKNRCGTTKGLKEPM
jgi:hypothetical protein